MNKNQIIDYINHTPENTNPEIVRQFLDNYAKTISEFYVNGNPVKETDYLYKLTYTTVNYKAGEEYTKHYKLNGGCSSIRKGNLYGRNFDWLYNNNCSFIIEVKGNEDRHASIGVSGHLRGLDKDFCSGMKWSDLYEILPSLTVDGINDAGVVANINVVPANTMGSTIGTNPGKPDLCLMSIVRLILDKCDTARDAIELVNQYNCFAPLRGDIAEEIHCMVADEDPLFGYNIIKEVVRWASDSEIYFTTIREHAPTLQ